MVRGLYTSAMGMTTQMQRIDVTSNNLANVNTTAFKRDGVASQAFADRLTMRLGDPVEQSVLRMMGGNNIIGTMAPGVFVDEVFTKWETGGIRATGGALDFALIGEGFFAVTATNLDESFSEFYSRDGSLTISSEGLLVTMDGARVQNLDGDNITLPNGDITIDSSGRIFVNEQYIDAIRIVNFENPESLRKTRGSFYATTEESLEIDFLGQVRQRYLENSNVDAVREMVVLIDLHRAYEANSRMVQVHDETIGKAVNDIARA